MLCDLTCTVRMYCMYVLYVQCTQRTRSRKCWIFETMIGLFFPSALVKRLGQRLGLPPPPLSLLFLSPPPLPAPRPLIKTGENQKTSELSNSN